MSDFDDVPEGFTVVQPRKKAAPSDIPEGFAEAPAASAAPAPPARPRRGDELEQPDPSPSGPVTAAAPKPALDITGSTARVQGEIRKGAPGEDVADAEARAKGIEDQGNPVKDDWIAKELISGAAAGPIIGKVAGAVAAPLRKAASAIAESSAGREAGRALTKIAEGAGDKLRIALGEVGPEAKAMLKDKPWLAKGKTSADLAKNFSEEGKTLGAERAKLLNIADQNAAAEGASPGVPLATVAEKVNARIAKLEKGTVGDKAIAKDLAAKREELLAAHQETGAIPSTRLREQMSEYQKVYGKAQTAVENTANEASKEMSKALGDALESHVNDPAMMSRIDELTDKMSVTTRAAKALEKKAGKEAAPGGPPTHGVVKQLAHDLTHTHAPGSLNTAGRVGKRLLSPAASAADRALGGLARRVDPAMAAIINRGVAEHWSAARLAQEITSSRGAQ